MPQGKFLRQPFDDENLIKRYDPNRLIDREENLQRFYEAIYTLYWQAQDTREKGISWRNFLVGSSMYAFRQDVYEYSAHWKVFRGMNTKVKEDSRNVCAEPISLNAAMSEGYNWIVGMVIVGFPQKDDKDILHLTLRPCSHCRMLMKNHPLITPETIIVTANPPPVGSEEKEVEIVHEIHTFAELLKAYCE